MSVLIWIQTVRHSDSVPERSFAKVVFCKSQQTTQNHEIYPARNEILNAAESLPSKCHLLLSNPIIFLIQISLNRFWQVYLCH